MLFDKHGKNWLFGTMDKYTFRFRNLARERDLLKIATYCYILWLKRGFHLSTEGVPEAVNTTVEMKSKYFSKFLFDIEEICSILNLSDRKLKADISKISDTLHKFSLLDWNNCIAVDIIDVYLRCYSIWEEKYSENEKHDTDTYNEKQPITV